MALKGHVAFALPDNENIGPRIVSHFKKIGYRLIGERPHEFVFERGSKGAALWRFDIRAYKTTLTVQMSPQKDCGVWVSCDWEVYTFMTITTGGDVETLEAEGRQLESVLRRNLPGNNYSD